MRRGKAKRLRKVGTGSSEKTARDARRCVEPPALTNRRTEALAHKPSGKSDHLRRWTP